MADYTYQIRSNISGRLLLEESSQEALISFLTARNPKAYDVYRLTIQTGEVRQVMNGKSWLMQNTEK